MGWFGKPNLPRPNPLEIRQLANPQAFTYLLDVFAFGRQKLQLLEDYGKESD